MVVGGYAWWMSTFTRFARTLQVDTSRPRVVGDFHLGDYVMRQRPNAISGWVKGGDSRGRLLVEDDNEGEHWVQPDRFVKVTSRRELYG